MNRGRSLIGVWHLTVAIFGGLIFIGCAKTLYPVTTGYHAPITEEMLSKKYRIVVWGNHPGMVNAIIGWAQEGGHTVVERARLQEIFNEQKIRLTHTPDDDADILRVGRLVGAEIVIFAEVTMRSDVVSRAYLGPYGGGGRSETVYHLSVAVRGVNVETGEVRWSGSATYPGPINNPDLGIVYLANSAINRALCRVKAGYEWKEMSAFGESGCIKK